MRIIIVGLYVFLYLLLGLPVLVIEWIISKFNKKAADYSQLRMVQWAFRCVAFLSGIKLTIKGEENILRDQPALYIANHRSIFDIVVTYPRFPSLTGFISKDGLNKIPSLHIWMRRVHCLFLDRNDLKKGLKVILTAIDKVNEGISICIFPEGTRNKNADEPASLLPFKDGAFKIAQKTGCPIIPMVMTGTDDIFENHFPWVHSTEVTLTFGKPILLSELTKEEQKHIGIYCQNIVQNMLNEELASKCK